MRRLLLATNNGHKLQELRRIIAEVGLDVQVTALGDHSRYSEPKETEETFEGNTLIKARAGVANTGLPTLADDSGLCVDVLNQMPGVRSSRWAGPNATDDENLELLLAQMVDVPAGRRGAKFVAAVALVLPNGDEFTTRGEMRGQIAQARRGSLGFGYDPIFVSDEQPSREGQATLLTNGELTAEQKDAISHRAYALQKMMPIVSEQLGGD